MPANRLGFGGNSTEFIIATAIAMVAALVSVCFFRWE